MCVCYILEDARNVIYVKNTYTHTKQNKYIQLSCPLRNMTILQARAWRYTWSHTSLSIDAAAYITRHHLQLFTPVTCNSL